MLRMASMKGQKGIKGIPDSEIYPFIYFKAAIVSSSSA
jgi:hypothetical protein